MSGAKSEPLLHPRPWSTQRNLRALQRKTNSAKVEGSSSIALICFQSTPCFSLSLAIISVGLQSPTTATVDSLRFRADFPHAAQEMPWMLAFGAGSGPSLLHMAGPLMIFCKMAPGKGNDLIA